MPDTNAGTDSDADFGRAKVAACHVKSASLGRCSVQYSLCFDLICAAGPNEFGLGFLLSCRFASLGGSSERRRIRTRPGEQRHRCRQPLTVELLRYVALWHVTVVLIDAGCASIVHFWCACWHAHPSLCWYSTYTSRRQTYTFGCDPTGCHARICGWSDCFCRRQ